VADLLVAYDPTASAGSRLAPEVQDEIRDVAPSTVGANSITEPKMANNAVSTRTVVDGAITEPKYADASVSTRALGAKQVTGAKIADDTIGPTQTGNGVATCADKDGNDIALRFVPISSSDYAAITTPDPNTIYLIS
jgi:hypothetical protein